MNSINQKVETPLLVTGATGYLASHIIKILLEQGYKVRGTVRSIAKKERYQFLYDLVPEKKNNLEFVEAELTDKPSWSKAVEGVEYIFHVASPITAGIPKDEMEIIRPAVEGTLNVLEAALEHKAKRVVVTSSCLTFMVGHSGRVLTEEDWSKEEFLSGYPKSKYLAEKAAWEFHEKNKSQIDIAIVHPSMILGPSFIAHGGASETVLKEIIGGQFPGAFDVSLPVVDVRDAAQAHINAMFSKDSNGKRHICSAASYPLGEIIKAAKDEFSRFGYKIKDGVITPEEALASSSEIAKHFVPLVGSGPQLSNERTRKELGVEFRSLKETVVDMGYSLIKVGAIENKLNQ